MSSVQPLWMLMPDQDDGGASYRDGLLLEDGVLPWDL